MSGSSGVRSCLGDQEQKGRSRQLILCVPVILLWKDGVLAACCSFLRCHCPGDAGYPLTAVPWAVAGDTCHGHAAPACFETHLEAAVRFYRAMLVDCGFFFV